MSKKTHWREFHPTDYIGSYAFSPGEDKVLTISRARRENVKDASGRSEECLVVHWEESEKPMIVNVTNSKAISKVAGSPFIEEWPGVAVSLFTTEVSAFGETVEAVRVRQTAPRKQKPELTPGGPKWDDAVDAVRGGTTLEKIRKHYRISAEHAEQLEDAAASEEVA